MSDSNRLVKERFAAWLVRTPAERRRLVAKGEQVPQTKAEFADREDVSARTLRRWERAAETGDDPFLAGLIEAERKKVEEARKPSMPNIPDDELLAVSDPDGDHSETAVQYRLVKQALHDKAMDGDTSALKLWLEKFGSMFVAAEQAALDSDLSSLSDEELLDQVQKATTTLGRLLAEQPDADLDDASFDDTTDDDEDADDE